MNKQKAPTGAFFHGSNTQRRRPMPRESGTSAPTSIATSPKVMTLPSSEGAVNKEKAPAGAFFMVRILSAADRCHGR